MIWLQLAAWAYLTCGVGVACFHAGLERGLREYGGPTKVSTFIQLVFVVFNWPLVVFMLALLESVRKLDRQ